MKRLLALVSVFLLLFQITPIAFATEADEHPNETSNKVWTWEDLQNTIATADDGDTMAFLNSELLKREVRTEVQRTMKRPACNSSVSLASISALMLSLRASASAAASCASCSHSCILIMRFSSSLILIFTISFVF